MRFPVKDKLTETDIRTGLNAVLKDGLTTQTMMVLVGGAFLTDFALRLGATNFIIGVIAAIGPLSQLIQMPSVFLVERFRNRRAMTVYAVLASRLFLLLIALIPFLFSHAIGLGVLLGALIFQNVLGAVGTCSWNSWMRDLVPQDRLGSFFSKRMAWATLLGIILSLGAGWFIDFWKDHHAGQALAGYSVIFSIGFAAGMLGAYFIACIPEAALEMKQDDFSLWQRLREPFQNTNFRKLIFFLAPWTFAVNLATPFFNVYLLKYLNYSLSLVIVLTVIQQTVYFMFLGIWGNFVDRFSNKTVLNISGLLFMLCILGFTFTTTPRPIITMMLLVLLMVLMGVAASGVTLATNNIGLKLAPRGSATTYLASISIINSLAAGIAPLLGGQLVDVFARWDLTWTLKWTSPHAQLAFNTLHFRHWDFLFAAAFLLGLYGLHRLALVKESGEVSDEVIINALILEMRSKSLNVLSALGVPRLMISFPEVVFKYLSRVTVKALRHEPDEKDAAGSKEKNGE
jgi:MFS family permease